MQKTRSQEHIHAHKRKLLIHDFNIEQSFGNGDIKDRENYRRTTNILKGVFYSCTIYKYFGYFYTGKSRKLQFQKDKRL